MYCQSCGKENPEEARFCMTCGTGIAAPGDKGGLIVEEADGPENTDLGIKTLPAGVPPKSKSEDKSPTETEDEEEPKKAVESKPVVSVENTLAGLKSQQTNTLTSVSLSMASISLRTPNKAGLIMVLLVLLLVGAGAAAMYGVMAVYSQNVAVIATTETPVPSQRPPLDLEKAPGGGEDGQFISSGPVVADLGTGKVKGGARPGTGGEAASKSGGASGSTKTPPTKSSKTQSGNDEGGSRSSSTTVEAPPDEGGGEGQSEATDQPGTSEGSSSEIGSGAASGPGLDEGGGERNIEMDMYAGHVRRVIRQFYAVRAQSCFDRATRNNHNLRGTVVVRFTVGGSGNVTRSAPARNTTGDDDLGQCLAGQVRSWRLPVPPNEQPVELEMPFSW